MLLLLKINPITHTLKNLLKIVSYAWYIYLKKSKIKFYSIFFYLMLQKSFYLIFPYFLFMFSFVVLYICIMQNSIKNITIQIKYSLYAYIKYTIIYNVNRTNIYTMYTYIIPWKSVFSNFPFTHIHTYTNKNTITQHIGMLMMMENCIVENKR